METGVPVGFGVLTCDTEDQALDRAGIEDGYLGHRGQVRLPVMASNGKRRPPRPRIELVAGGASASEAAAIVAALERFLADTAPTPTVVRVVNK